MVDENDLPELTSFLSRSWEMDFENRPNVAELEVLLAERLKELIMHDFERLVQAMYRMDVNEGKFAIAMACSSVNEQASALAKIVLERELQRLAFRKKYRSGGNEQT